MIADTRLGRAITALVQALTNKYEYHALVRYRVVIMIADRVALQSVHASKGWPDQIPLSILPGISGWKAKIQIGSEVLVAFVEGDPTQPVVVGFVGKSDPGGIPIDAELDSFGDPKLYESAISVQIASGSDPVVTPIAAVGRVVRYGDPVFITGSVVAGPGAPPGTVTGVLANSPAAPTAASKVKA